MRQLTWVSFQADPSRDDSSYHRLLCGIRGEKPGFKPNTPRFLQAAGTDTTIMPRGLRSFESEDHEWFLNLVPGPRDPRGLPSSIRFWKGCLEQIDSERTFKVGLILGPSGCGKSSLVKAGLIPALAEFVVPVYVEATSDTSEERLLRALQKAVDGLPSGLSLTDTVAHLQRSPDLLAGRKVVIFLDQFEQYLHATPSDEQKDLVDALRECDGGKLQCVAMVRDDFITPVTRFIKQLEVRLADDRNYAMVDLFDKRHAKKVLALFGRAFGALPKSGNLRREQDAFLDQAVFGLAEGDYVICVRLALFAQMVRAKEWTPATLKAVGGAHGVGAAFLEDSFVAKTAPLENRRHQKAAREVLGALLPEPVTDIRGAMKSRQQLLEKSGYARRPDEFDELLEVLDTKLRLVTPTEAIVVDSEDAAPEQPPEPAKYYQLTHDYLVPSLREWLTRKKKESWRGRSELRLAERSSLWNDKQENRHLPRWWEYLNIRLLTHPARWTGPQRKMMDKAGRVHLMRAAILAAIIVLAFWAGYELNGRVQARALVDSLISAQEDAIPGIVGNLQPYRRWARPRLRKLLESEPQTPQERRQQLHVRLALVPEDRGQVSALLEELLEAEVEYIGVIRDALNPYRPNVVGNLWDRLQDASEAPESRFRAGLALAGFATHSDRWRDEDRRFLAEQLVSSNPDHQTRLREYLSPVGKDLIDELERLFADSQVPETWQITAANALADFARKDKRRLAHLLTLATSAQYSVLYPLIEEGRDQAAIGQLRDSAAMQPDENLRPLGRVDLGRSRAGAAITLLRGGEWQGALAALRVQDDPESQTQFVHRCRGCGVRPQQLLECLQNTLKARAEMTGASRKTEERVLFGLLLALGEFGLDELPEDRREPLVKQLGEWYRSDPASAIHGVCGWLLRHWDQESLAREVDQTPVSYDPGREWYTLKIDTSAPDSSDVKPSGDSTGGSLYLTFIVFPPGEYEIGSPEDEPRRDSDETRHTVQITRAFAVLDREVTREEYEAFAASYPKYGLPVDKHSPTPQHPMVGPNWYKAVRFCRWLTTQAGMSEQEQACADPASLDEQQFPVDPSAYGAPRNWPLRLDRPGFRLPTEAEWEIACRGGVRVGYGFGGDAGLLHWYGWFHDNSNEQVHVPRSLRPNLRGVFDMHGNVLEWCHDWYGDYVAEDVEYPQRAIEGAYRVLRGGCIAYDAKHCRAAFRSKVDPGIQLSVLGFRVAAVPPSQ